jgi:hypothetical protein
LPAQEVQSSFPQEKVLISLPKGANSPWPLRSVLSQLHLRTCLASYTQILGKSRLGDVRGYL